METTVVLGSDGAQEGHIVVFANSVADCDSSSSTKYEIASAFEQAMPVAPQSCQDHVSSVTTPPTTLVVGYG